MKKLLQTYPDNCIACHACESACSNAYFKVDDPLLSRIRISDEGGTISMNACNQCGICVQTCPTQALGINSQGVVMLNAKLCIGCYMCVAACPTNSMFIHKGQTVPFKCVACGICTQTCPADAIRIETKEN